MVVIRDATSRDLPRILEIEHLAFPSPWSLHAFKRELTLPFSRLTVAENGPESRPMGFLCRWLVADECHILNIAVHPESRRLGVGAELLKAAISEAMAKDALVVTLEVRRSNLPARQLYRKFQFHERRLRKHYYGPDEDAIVMELSLSPH